MKNKHSNISKLLSIASCSLIGTQLNSSVVNASDWEIKNTVLFYSESDDRVQAIETVSNLKKQINEDESISVSLTYDALTGASPNGASPTNILQTFTSPSGNSSFSTLPGETPIDHAFNDTRYALSGNWIKNHNRLLSSSIGLALSKETDYDSLGINATVTKYSTDKNTSYQAGISINKDKTKPLGGVPIPFLFIFPPSTFNNNLSKGDFIPSDSETKNNYDINFGISHILSKNIISQVSLSYSKVDGYQTDPYKIISFIEQDTGNTLFYINENRPQKRTKKSFYSVLKYHRSNHNILTPSIRYFKDDWGIESYTLNLKYRINLNSRNFIEPKVRYYNQSAAGFYHHSLSEIDNLEYASADYRLAKFNASTVGLKFGHEFNNQSLFEIRLEYYVQNGEDHPDDAIGIQQGLDLFAEVKATILQLNYNFNW